MCVWLCGFPFHDLVVSAKWHLFLLENFNNFLSCMFSVLSLEHLLSDVRLPEFIPLGLLTF